MLSINQVVANSAKIAVTMEPPTPNMALNLAPFGRWTLRIRPRSAGLLYVSRHVESANQRGRLDSVARLLSVHHELHPSRCVGNRIHAGDVPGRWSSRRRNIREKRRAL